MAMKTIKQALKLRDSIFDESKRDDTLDLDNLVDNSIDGDRFFEETYITEGMRLLFDTVFKRFRGQSASPIIKLTQAMGGGKTHNMVAVGVLAQSPSIRNRILDGKYSDFKKGVKVVAYTGRNSDLEYGIWGEIARQLGKENQFAPYYSPTLKAPGQSAWIELLKSDTPTLILLDELPPYLQYCKTQQYASGTLMDITENALANLFNALNKEELHNVTLVISDLEATYQEGSEIIKGMFDNLQNEVHRSSVNIEPVGANTDDLYHILRTRLFANVAPDTVIDEIALGYQESVKEAKEMNYTDENPSDIAKGIRTSYPFHPAIRDLFARFKENPGFQQTRGFIRLTREMVKGLWGENGLAGQRYLINPYDIDLNNTDMVTIIKSIKPELSPAIAHDIASDGKSVAEHLDAPLNSTDMQDLTKLILMASLGKSHGTVTGLTMNEAIAYISTPGRDIRNFNKELDELKQRAWYLYFDRDNRLFFRQVQNVNAKLNDEIRGFTYEQAKLHIKDILKEQFKPLQSDCYQEVLVFPSIEEIDLKKNKVTLILTEPGTESFGLKEEVLKFYDDATFKNRVMFLTGQRVAMKNLIDITKEYKAIENIVYEMEHGDNVASSNSELNQAKDIFDKKSMTLMSTIREAFVTLHFPKKNGLSKHDFKMTLVNNAFNAEKEIRDVLIEVEKFTTDIEPNSLRKKFEVRIFTQKRMTWNHILERVASETSWQWHKPSALDDLRNDSIRKGLWIEEGGYIDKEPPAPETSVIVRESYRDGETGEVTLGIQAINGDTVYYEIDDDATTASAKVPDLSSFKTNELKLSFLCVDATGVNETGGIYHWTNKVNVKYREFDQEGKRFLELSATSPQVEIRYTTDGSNPENNGGTYREPFEIINGTKFVQAIAVNKDKGISSEVLVYEVRNEQFSIDKEKPVYLNEVVRTASTSETYSTLETLKEVETKVKNVEIAVSESGGTGQGFMVLNFGQIEISNIEGLIDQLNQLIDNFFADKKYEVTATINNTEFETGQAFEQWVAKRKETVDKYKGKIRQ